VHAISSNEGITYGVVLDYDCVGSNVKQLGQKYALWLNIDKSENNELDDDKWDDDKLEDNELDDDKLEDNKLDDDELEYEELEDDELEDD